MALADAEDRLDAFDRILGRIAVIGIVIFARVVAETERLPA